MTAPHLEEQVLDALKAHDAWLITLESCTGGLIAHRITNIPGSSAVYWGGQVVYANSAKSSLAQVPEQLLREHGAVSSRVARALAESGLETLRRSAPPDKAHYAIATTGIAGPGGGSTEKPIGLCFVAAASSLGETQVEQIQAPSHLDRAQIKSYFADTALSLLLKSLRGATAYA